MRTLFTAAFGVFVGIALANAACIAGLFIVKWTFGIEMPAWAAAILPATFVTVASVSWVRFRIAEVRDQEYNARPLFVDINRDSKVWFWSAFPAFVLFGMVATGWIFHWQNESNGFRTRMAEYDRQVEVEKAVRAAAYSGGYTAEVFNYFEAKGRVMNYSGRITAGSEAVTPVLKLALKEEKLDVRLEIAEKIEEIAEGQEAYFALLRSAAYEANIHSRYLQNAALPPVADDFVDTFRQSSRWTKKMANVVRNVE